MTKKVLTYLTILAITLVPVKLISANVENLKMQMSMQMHMVQQTQVKNDCMHSMDTEKVSVDKLCCDEQSNQCQSCNNCPQAANAMTAVFTSSHVNDENYTVSLHLLKPGVSLLPFFPSSIYRPPKI